jgi:hypothetical protein
MDTHNPQRAQNPGLALTLIALMLSFDAGKRRNHLFSLIPDLPISQFAKRSFNHKALALQTPGQSRCTEGE